MAARYSNDGIANKLNVPMNTTNIGLESREHPEERHWKNRVAQQGPWDESDETFSKDGAESIPMPVRVAPPEEFEPFFRFLATHSGDWTWGSAEPEFDSEAIDCSVDMIHGFEPHYDIELVEFNRGVLYADRRLDLCKQVLGPPSLPLLLEALEHNEFVRHFLFGNNIIGPNAARRIAQWVKKHPDRMETWYLAGNCINKTAFSALAESWSESSSLTNLWLKRNPLGPDSAMDIVQVITKAPNLRTLDLDQTSLGDACAAKIFSCLADYTAVNKIALKHIYLGADGVSSGAAREIARFLATPNCQLVSLYLSWNPLGSSGATILSEGICANCSLERLFLQSVGMTDDGAIAIMDAAASHSAMRVLDIGHTFSTEDMGARYNWLTGLIVPSAQNLIRQSPHLQYLSLGYTQIPQSGLNKIMSTIVDDPNHDLLFFSAKPAIQSIDDTAAAHEMARVNQMAGRLRWSLRDRLHHNVRKIHGPHMDYQTWLSDERRWLKSPTDVRFIDSVYRNRDTAAARRGLKVLKKQWDPNDTTLLEVEVAE